MAAGRSAADHSASGAVLAPLESSLVQPLRPFWWARARSIGQRKVRHQLRARDCADDGRPRQGGRDQRRDRIHQGCQAEGQCARKTLRTGDVDRSHQDQQRCEGRRDQRQRQGRVAGAIDSSDQSKPNKDSSDKDPIRSALIRTRYRCSSAMPRTATVPISRTGPARHCPPSSLTSRRRKSSARRRVSASPTGYRPYKVPAISGTFLLATMHLRMRW